MALFAVRRTSQQQLASLQSPVEGAYIKPPIPNHWKCKFDVPKPFSTICELLFSILCLIHLGRPDLEQAWIDITEADETEWIAKNDRQNQRVGVLNVVAGLLLGTTAAFVTTVPPAPSLLDYIQPRTYICLLIAFSLNLASFIVGCTQAYVMTQSTREWQFETLMSSRSRVWSSLILAVFPFLGIGASTIVMSLGILLAVLKSENDFIRHGSVAIAFAPTLLIPLFLWTQAVRFVRQTGTWMGKLVHPQRKTNIEESSPLPEMANVPRTEHLMVERVYETAADRQSMYSKDDVEHSGRII